MIRKYNFLSFYIPNLLYFLSLSLTNIFLLLSHYFFLSILLSITLSLSSLCSYNRLNASPEQYPFNHNNSFYQEFSPCRPSAAVLHYLTASDKAHSPLAWASLRGSGTHQWGSLLPTFTKIPETTSERCKDLSFPLISWRASLRVRLYILHADNKNIAPVIKKTLWRLYTKTIYRANIRRTHPTPRTATTETSSHQGRKEIAYAHVSQHHPSGYDERLQCLEWGC